MDRRELGFWHSLRKTGGEDIFGWATLSALVIGVGGGVLTLAHTHEAARHAISSDFLVVLGPLLGVVVAAFALVISLFSEDYLRVLADGKDGVIGFMRPFIVGIGIQVGTIIWTVAFRASDAWLPSKGEVGSWLVLCFLFVLSMLDVVALAKTVLAHGVTRAEDIRIRDIEASNNVIQHQRRQGGASQP